MKYILLTISFLILFSCSTKNVSTVSGKITIGAELKETGKIIISKYWWDDISEKRTVDINADGTFNVTLKDKDQYHLTFIYPNHQPMMLELSILNYKDVEVNINFK